MPTDRVAPLWLTIPRAIRWFNYRYSLPRVGISSCRIGLGARHVGAADRPLVLTSSISEDYARLWLFFARRALPADRWDFLIVDSAGDMEPAKLGGATVVRYLNVYHGRKIDTLLRRTVRAETVFLCDDDKYLTGDVTSFAADLEDARTPVVSLAPRAWWKFRIEGREYLPMGSYALLLKRSAWLDLDLRLESPRGLESPYRIFPPTAKPQTSYDTADYANEQLLLQGYRVVTRSDVAALTGFDGLSAPRVLLMHRGKAYVKKALLQAEHFRDGSINGAVMKAMYGMVKIERLYRAIFGEAPRLSTGFTERELLDVIECNVRLDGDQRAASAASLAPMDDVCDNLMTTAGR